jgi:hypothetical protein
MEKVNYEKDNLRAQVRGAYQLQKLRIQMGNRIVANWKVKLGQAPSMAEDELEEAEKTILKDLRASHKLLSAAIAESPRREFKGHGLINTFTEYCLVSQFLDIEAAEVKHFKHLEKILRDYPIYTEFLLGVKGCGPAMAGCIISELDPYKAKYPSSFWKYCGLDVADDGAGRSRKGQHLVEQEYLDADGETKFKKGITFNPFIKTKLMGVLGGSFLKSKSSYADIYYNYKARLEQHPIHKEKSKGHRHNMATRYAIKIFLIDLHKKWRELEGLPVSVPYHEAKLGIKHAA